MIRDALDRAIFAVVGPEHRGPAQDTDIRQAVELGLCLARPCCAGNSVDLMRFRESAARLA